MNSMPQLMHFMDGFVPSGPPCTRRYRAVCTCGFSTTPRASEARALQALESEHGTSPAVCALCLTDYAGEPWDVVKRKLEVYSDGREQQFAACHAGCRRPTREETARRSPDDCGCAAEIAELRKEIADLWAALKQTRADVGP